MELPLRVLSLSTLILTFGPSGHSGEDEPSGKKQALPENTPTSPSGIDAPKTPGERPSSGMSDRRAAEVGPEHGAALSRQADVERDVKRVAAPAQYEVSGIWALRHSSLHVGASLRERRQENAARPRRHALAGVEERGPPRLHLVHDEE